MRTQTVGSEATLPRGSRWETTATLEPEDLGRRPCFRPEKHLPLTRGRDHRGPSGGGWRLTPPAPRPPNPVLHGNLARGDSAPLQFGIEQKSEEGNRGQAGPGSELYVCHFCTEILVPLQARAILMEKEKAVSYNSSSQNFHVLIGSLGILIKCSRSGSGG